MGSSLSFVWLCLNVTISWKSSLISLIHSLETRLFAPALSCDYYYYCYPPTGFNVCLPSELVDFLRDRDPVYLAHYYISRLRMVWVHESWIGQYLLKE